MLSLRVEITDPMDVPFANRTYAGHAVAQRLAHYRGSSAVVVLAIPMGGVPVAVSVANELALEFHVLPTARISLPGDTRTWAVLTNNDIVVRADDKTTGFVPTKIAADAAFERARTDLAHQTRIFGGSPPPLAGKTVILVDDGIESGLTMQAAIDFARASGASKIACAAPVGSSDAIRQLADKCDEVVSIAVPKPFHNIAECYIDFSPVTEDTCIELVGSMAAARAATSR